MGKIIDETSNQYGKWIVLEYDQSSKGKKAKWICRCSCGKIASVVGSDLRGGFTKGCHQCADRGFINEIGNSYGKLKVLRLDETSRGKQIKWICQCECGNITSILGVSLRGGHTKSCYKCCDTHLRDEIGKRYGKLLVIERDGSTNARHAKWLCKCDCGNISSVVGIDLRSGHTRGCKECAGTALINEIGNRYGRLLVIEQNRNSSGGGAKWLCQCDCGTTVSVSASNLRDNKTISCGCLRSKGEEIIGKILTDYNILFKKEYIFPDLKDKNFLRFDFAIFNNDEDLIGLIEYQGAQHFDKTNNWYNEDIVKHDKMKVVYCKDNNIPLIFFTNQDNLTWELIKSKIEVKI